MPYRVKEIFRSICGEGSQSGRVAVFVRFSGCNGWNGLESGRGRGPLGCSAWCDTDFVGGDVHPSADSLADAASLAASGADWCVLTGGEPTLQADNGLVDALRDRGFGVQIETNGTRPIPAGIDFVTVSPKPGGTLVVTSGDELKLVHPTLDPVPFSILDFGRFYLQPLDGPDAAANLALARDYCLAHPGWRLAVQVHKLIGLP